MNLRPRTKNESRSFATAYGSITGDGNYSAICDRDAEWKAFRKKFARLLKDAVRLSERKGRLQSAVYDRRKKRLHHRLAAFLQIAAGDKDVKRLSKRIRKHQDELITFLDHENVSPYNNHAEQQMHKPILTRKVSQQNRSDQGAKTQAILMSPFRSADLQKKNPVETILSMSKSILATTGNQIVGFQGCDSWGCANFSGGDAKVQAPWIGDLQVIVVQVRDSLDVIK